MNTASPVDRALALLQLMLPTRWLSTGMYWLTRRRWTPFKNGFIRIFMRLYSISLEEAEVRDIAQFEHFNAFFTRALRRGARPLAPEPTLLSPVDGTLSQCGSITRGQLIQAKGHKYDCASLLADPALADDFDGGTFATIYLAPYNYHRIHMPTDATLRGWRYVPGRAFSVNARTARAMPRLFARNERLVVVFDTPRGALSMILVGALFVSGIETVWTGPISPPHRRGSPGPMQHLPAARHFARGEEMGRFNMGSTVILVAAPGVLRWSEDLQPGRTVRMGEAIGD